MSDKTRIEWTDATWNPVTGCTKVSEGCDHCYAETIAHRFAGTKAYPDGFAVTLRPERLDQPLRWQRPRRIFVNSMSDLFHADVPDEYIARVFAVMACSFLWSRPTHTFQVLTKRPGRMRSLLTSDAFREEVASLAAQMTDEDHCDSVSDAVEFHYWPLPNVWLGVSVESQKWADVRIPQLLVTPAAVRFLSCEPLLGPVDLTPCNCRPGSTLGCARHNFGSLTDTQLNAREMHYPAIDWVIVGGESGPHARPMHLDWARGLRDQCVSAGIAFHFKQWGEWKPLSRIGVGVLEGNERFGEVVDDGKFTEHTWRRKYLRVGKKAAGRELDGRTWDEYPEAQP